MKENGAAAGGAVSDEPTSEFIDWLHKQGELIDELSAAFVEVVTSVVRLGKKGSLTLKVGVEPAGRTILIHDEVVAKPPLPPRDPQILYPDASGRVFHTDPYELKLDTTAFKTVEHHAGGLVKTIDHETGTISWTDAAGNPMTTVADVFGEAAAHVDAALAAEPHDDRSAAPTTPFPGGDR
jgi:hypothetical protein